MMRGLGAGLVAGVLLGAAEVVAGPPVVQHGLRAAVPLVQTGIRDGVTAVEHMVPPASPKPGGSVHG